MTNSFAQTTIKICLWLLMTAVFGLNVEAYGQKYYQVTEIGPFDNDPKTSRMTVYAINSSGQVVGSTSTPLPEDRYRASAFVWQNGVMTNLGLLLGNSHGSSALDINDGGQVVGSGIFGDAPGVHAIWWHDGTYTDLHPILMGSGLFNSLLPADFTQSEALKINEDGQIMGRILNSRNDSLGFIYHHGSMTVVPRPGVATWPQYCSMNNLGQVVGYFPVDQAGTAANTFIWHNGLMTILTQPEGSPTSNGSGINDSGTVVGSFYPAVGAPAHGFIYEAGTFRDVGNFFPIVINNSGLVGGNFVNNPPDYIVEAAIYYDGEMQKLNDLVPTDFYRNSEYRISNLRGINDQGQLLGQRLSRVWIDGVGYINFVHNLLLAPVTDTTAPQVFIHNLSVAADSQAGAVVNYGFYGFSATDDFDRHPSIIYSQSTPSLFPIGTTTVTATAWDASGNTTVVNFHVTVIDTAPNLSLPETIFTDATSAAGATVNFVASANDVVSGDLPVTCSSASGSVFPAGETTVTCTATDGAGNTSTGDFKIFVLTAGQEGIMPGDLVAVTSSDGRLSLNFTYVAQPGVTTIAPIDPGTIGNTPSGFAVSDVAYEISTTSAGATDNGVMLGFVVPNSANTSQSDFELLRVLHNNNGTLEDITYNYDYDNRIVYAFTYSFSPFYLVRTVTTNIETLFDRSKAHKAGSTIPVKIRLKDGATNANISSSFLAVTARSVKRLGNSTTLTASDSGSANPDNNFRYLGEKDGGTYIFNLSTKGLQAGSYALSFYVGTDRSFFYSVKFEVK